MSSRTEIIVASKAWRLALAAAIVGLSVATTAAAGKSAVVIDGCRVFDPNSGEMESARTILIRGDRIVAVTLPGEPVDAPAEAVRIDGRGKFAVPGFIDAHVHLMHVLDFAHVSGDDVLPLYIAAGVTTVRSTGDEIVAATLIARMAAQNPERCPRVFTCSPVLDADPPIHRDIGRSVSELSQIPALIEEMKRWRATTIKIYAGTGRTIGRAVIDEAHRQGMFVTGHLGDYPAHEAVEDGIDCIEHITSVFGGVVPPGTPTDTASLGELNLQNPVGAALIERIVERQTFVDPTLVVFRNMLLLPDAPDVKDHPDNALAPHRLQEYWPVYLLRNGCPQGGALADRRRLFAKYQELTGLLHRSGVRLLAGTDAPEPQVTPGFALHQELELLVESGLTPAAALTAATLTNAAALGQAQQMGSIAPGKLADVVLLNANPLDDVRNTRQIELVIHGGAVSRPADVLGRASRD